MLKLNPFHLRAKLRAASLYRAALIVGIGAFAVLAAALLYQAGVGSAEPPERLARVFGSFAGNRLIGLGMFGALAFGYTYWALDLIDEPGEQLRWVRFASEALFVLAVLAGLLGLMVWNIVLWRAG